MGEAPPDLPEAQLALLQRQVKSELRRQMRAVRRVLPLPACALRSAAACERVLSLPQYASARVVAAYAALRKELDPSAAITRALADGKTVALPRVHNQTLTLHAYRSGDALEESGYEIMEPLRSAPQLMAAEIELILVPALALDPRGHRIGYGQGFYDHLLPDLPRAYKVGLAYDFQIVAELPNDAHDVPVDCVVTDARTLVI